MGMRFRTVRMLCGLVGLAVLANCATTQETVQECRQAAYSFCDKTVKSKPGPADPSARNSAYQQCLETQVAACGIR